MNLEQSLFSGTRAHLLQYAKHDKLDWNFTVKCLIREERMRKIGITASFDVTHRLNRSLSARIYSLLTIDSRTRFIERDVAPSHVILDMGCGGGWVLLREKARYIIGIDLFLPALRKAKQVYDDAILADFRFLPIRDNCLDALISMDVLGHVPNDRKDETISEIFRVLRSFGYTYHLVETDGSGIIPRLLKRSPSIYSKYMVDLDGHVGLEPPRELIIRFETRSDVVKAVRIYSGLFWPISSYLRRLDNECKQLSTTIRLLVKVSRLMIKTPLSYALGDCVLRILTRFYDLITPFSYADGVYIIARKIPS